MVCKRDLLPNFVIVDIPLRSGMPGIGLGTKYFLASNPTKINSTMSVIHIRNFVGDEDRIQVIRTGVCHE
jgi:hypothetical protein